jgi:hypothetical protein
MILAVVLIVIAGVAYLGIRGGTNSDDNGEGEQRSFAYRLNADHIVQFTVTHGVEAVTYLRVPSEVDDSMIWVFDDEDRTPADMVRLTGIQYILAGPRADKRFEDEISNATQYGLDEPVTLIDIQDRSGGIIHLELGDFNVDRSLQYVSVQGDPDVYMIHESWTRLISGFATDPAYIPTPEPIPTDIAIVN